MNKGFMNISKIMYKNDEKSNVSFITCDRLENWKKKEIIIKLIHNGQSLKISSRKTDS